jgi:hypothetical protein
MDRRPERLLESGVDPVPEKLLGYIKKQDWVLDAAVRLREDGRLFVGEAFIVPKGDFDLTRRISELTKNCCEMDWRLSEFTVSPTLTIPNAVKQSQPRAPPSVIL